MAQSQSLSWRPMVSWVCCVALSVACASRIEDCWYETDRRDAFWGFDVLAFAVLWVDGFDIVIAPALIRVTLGFGAGREIEPPSYAHERFDVCTTTKITPIGII